MSNLTTINSQLDVFKPDFERVLSDKTMNFEREAMFACQILAGNNYTAGIAQSNIQSFKAAICNVAAFGITLNPASKLAYLVPRNKAIMLDISYMGLMHIAQQSGAIQWCQSLIVRKNDVFKRQGIDKAPLHEYNDFAAADERGEIIGVYCVVKTEQGDFLTHCMSIDQVNDIKKRSASVQSGKKSPWDTDPEQMILKTCVKQASKYWPRRDRLDSAISYLNDPQNEGIDFAKNSTPELSENQEKERVALITLCVDSYKKDRENGLGVGDGRLKEIWGGLTLSQKKLIGSEAWQEIKAGKNPLEAAIEISIEDADFEEV